MRGYRKLAVVALVLLLAFVLALLRKLSAEFAQIAVTALGAFGLGNAVEHWRNGKPDPH